MRRIIANYDDEGVHVYQAFKPATVQAALQRGTFDKGFSFDRITWIKPSFGWMLGRSAYAAKHRQEAIVKIKISHEGFREMLSQGVETYYNSQLFATEEEWRTALEQSEVRYQWDPDRGLRGEKLEQRAIQIGMRGETVQKYVHQWILNLEDVTPLAHRIGQAVKEKNKILPQVPAEREYQVDENLMRVLDINS